MNDKIKTPVANKRSYAIGVLVVYQAFQLASGFITGDTNATPKSPTAHTADRSLINDPLPSAFGDE